MPKRSPLTTPDWQAAVRRRTQFYLLIAFLLAVLFGVLVFQFFWQRQAQQPQELTNAIFANQDISLGTTLTADVFVARQVPLDAVPPLHFQFYEPLVGRVTLYPIVAGEVILPGKLVGGTSGGPIAQRCPQGLWCVNIPEAWFVAAPPDLAEGDELVIAAAQPGLSVDEAGFVASQVLVVALPNETEGGAYVLAVEGEEALNILYSHANEFQMLILLHPAGK